MTAWWNRRNRRRERLATEIERELSFHFAEEVERLIELGVDPETARERVRRELGDRQRTEARMRRLSEQRERREGLGLSLAATRRDAVAAWRALRARPGVLAASVVTLALGVGATTTMFSVADGVLWRQLPYPDAERLVLLGGTFPHSESISPVAPPVVFDWQEQNRVFASLAGTYQQPLDYRGPEEPVRLRGAGVSAAFSEVLQIAPAFGRWFTRAEDSPNGRRVAVVSHAAWQAHWGGAADVLGTEVSLDGQPFTLIGVMPRDFRGPEQLRLDEIDVWFPLAFIREDLTSHANWFIRVIGRLQDGISIDTATDEMTALTGRLVQGYSPEAYEDGIRFRADSLTRLTIGDASESLVLLLAAVGTLMLIACANATHLSLAQANDRRGELSVRIALGATRADLVRQLLFESLGTALLAGGLGAVLARVGVSAFVQLNPGDLPRLAEVAVSPSILLPTLGLTLLTAILVGTLPALHAAGSQGERGSAGSRAATTGRRERRIRQILVGLEVAVAVVLLAGAGLLINSLVRLARVDPGFRAEGVDVVHLDLGDRYPDYPSRTALFDEVLERLRSEPGVESAALANGLPFGDGGSAGSVVVENTTSEDLPPFVRWQLVSDGFAETLGAQVVEGRDLGAQDLVEGQRTVLVNAAFARLAWPDARAVGKRLKVIRSDDADPWAEVVGVISDFKQGNLAANTSPEIYVPYRHAPVVFPRVDFFVRSALPPDTLAPSLRAAVWTVDARQPVAWIATLAARIDRTMRDERFYAAFLGTFATLSVSLACIGVYAALAYLVGRRTREIGIRMAIGATRRELVTAVVRDGMVPVASGTAVGIASAMALSGLLESYVFAIEPTDPPTLAAAAVLLLAVAAVAAWIPARRASHVDPVLALRSD